MYPHIPMHIPSSRTAGSLGLSFTLFTVFQSACTNLHSYQQSVRVLIVPHSCQHFILAILVGVQRNHTVFWFSFPQGLMKLVNFQAIEHFQHSHEASVEVSCPLFLLGWQFFSVLFWQSPLYILDTSMWAVFFIYLVQMYYIQMEMTENGVRSKGKIMGSAVSGQDMINLRLL